MIIGIDPGMNGAMCLMNEAGSIYDVCTFAKHTEHEIAETLEEWTKNSEELKCSAFIENVHSMPKQGVVSSFKFGDGCGFLRGVITAFKVPFERVTPQAWQKSLGCMSKGDKNITKAAAQRLWPDRTWTHAISDAALIAEYGRRISK